MRGCICAGATFRNQSPPARRSRSVCGSAPDFHADTCNYVHPHSDSNAELDPRIYADEDVDAYAYEHAANTERNPDEHPHSNADGYADQHAHADEHAKCDPDSNPNHHSDCDANTECDGYVQRDTDSHPNRHGRANRDTN
jgi:hypothetical protein